MSTTITAVAMSSTTTPHSASYVPELGVWRVTWLPRRDLTRNQAVTAMTLAESVSTHQLHHDDPHWAVVDSLAAELGYTGPAAVGLIADHGADLVVQVAR